MIDFIITDESLTLFASPTNLHLFFGLLESLLFFDIFLISLSLEEIMEGLLIFYVFLDYPGFLDMPFFFKITVLRSSFEFNEF